MSICKACIPPVAHDDMIHKIYPDYAAYTDYSGKQIVSQLLMPLKRLLKCCVNEFTKQLLRCNMLWTPAKV